MLADEVAILNGANGTATSPFIVSGGNVYINSAYIAEGTINIAKIADVLQSTNYVAGTTGWKIQKSGAAEFNNVTVRGTVEAAQIKSSYFNIGDLKILSESGDGRYCPLLVIKTAQGNDTPTDAFYASGYTSGYSDSRVARVSQTYYVAAIGTAAVNDFAGTVTITVYYSTNGTTWTSFGSNAVPISFTGTVSWHGKVSISTSSTPIYFKAIWSAGETVFYSDMWIEVKAFNL